MLIPFYNFILQVTSSEQASNRWGEPRPHTIVGNEGIENEGGDYFDNN